MSVIGYLVSEYYAPSHTFVRREVAALRKLGETVQPFSIQRERDAEDGFVCAVLGQSALTHLRAFASHCVRRPARLMKVWTRALSHRAPGLRGLLWSQFHFVEASTLAVLLEQHGVGHLHNHFANNGATVGMLAAQLAGIDWSMTLHGISETDYPAGLLLPGKLDAASFTACASLFMRAQAMRVSHPHIWQRFHIVRCGIDIDALPTPKHDTARDGEGSIHIVCVGRLSPEKGYGVMAHALTLLREADQLNHRVTIVGDGSAQQEIKADFEARQLTDITTFTGALGEAETLKTIANADMLVLPSLMEGLPVVLMEALALRVPVIASGVAGIPELIEHGKTGLTVIPTDAPALAQAIKRLTDDPALRDRLAQAGRARIEEEFTSNESARRMQALFHAN